MAKLSDADIQGHLDTMTGWTLEDNMIKKTFKQQTFPGVIAFVTHIGFLAEAAAHHPDLDIRYNKLTVGLTTHSAGGLTEKDFVLANQIDELMV